MKATRKLIRRSAWWDALARLTEALTVATAIAVGALTVVLIGARLTSATVSWDLALAAAAGLCVIGALVWTLATRPSEMRMAQRLDEGAELRETLSTALAVERNEDAWSRATVAQSESRAGRVILRQALPFRRPRGWIAPMIALAAWGAAWMFTPNADLLGALADRRARDEARVDVEQVRAIVDEEKKKVEALVGELDPPEREAGGADAPEAALNTPEDVRISAIKELTTLKDRVDALLEGERAARLDQALERLERLRQAGAGEIGDLVKMLQQGRLQEASEALRKLAERLAGEEMDAETRERLRKQLEDLAKQLAAQGAQQDALKKQLERLGIDPALASDMNALAKALESMSHLSQAQKQALMDMAKASDGACRQCRGLSQQLSAAAQQMAQGQSGAQGLTGAGDMLSELEMLAQEMAAADAAAQSLAQQLRSLGQGLCQGTGESEFNMWQIWAQQNNTRGDGGMDMNAAEAAFNTKKERTHSQNQGGPIIATRLVEGEQVRGEARAAFSEVVATSAAGAAEAIESNAIPREFHDPVKRYFGRLARKAQLDEAEAAQNAEETTETTRTEDGAG